MLFPLVTILVPSPSSMRSVARPRVEVGMSEFKMSDLKFFLGASTKFCHKFELSDRSEKFSNELSEVASCWYGSGCWKNCSSGVDVSSSGSDFDSGRSDNAFYLVANFDFSPCMENESNRSGRLSIGPPLKLVKNQPFFN